MPYSLLTDKEANFEAMRRLYNQREKTKHTVITLPCHKVKVEILKPEDQYLECPTCHKKYLLSYSIANTKLYGE
jgi:hypothetical protein